jgi:hypothetical protein
VVICDFDAKIPRFKGKLMIVSARHLLTIFVLAALALPLYGCKEEKGATGEISAAVQVVDAKGAEGLLAVAARLQSEVAFLRGYWMCVDTEFSFDRVHDMTSTAYDNENSPAGFRCHILGATGGVEQEIMPDIDWLEEDRVDQPIYGSWYYNGSHYVPGAGVGDASVSDRDLIAFLPYVRADICAGVNEALGIEGIPAIEGVQWLTPFQGTYVGNGVALLPPARLSGCFNDGGKNVFYQVLLVR